MMSRISQKVPVILLWLAGLAFCAHLMVPHDHHFNDSLSQLEDTCPASGGKPEQGNGIPMHCHAFNSVASEKPTTFQVIKVTVDHSYSPIRFTEAFQFEPQLTSISVPDFQNPFFYSVFPEIFPLRGPPSLA